MEIPDKVTGREGKSLFLFCFFAPPFNEYKGNISIIWKNAKGNVTFLHYTNYPSAHGFENHIWNNKDSRYQILGNPRKNDASIVIKQLRSNENGKGFCCQIDFTEESTGKCEEGIRTKITDVQGARLSPVTVKVGDSATLPCNFTPPDKKPSSIGIIWMKGNLPNVSIVFNQTRYRSANRPYANTVNEGDRYELVGNPEQGNASIKVTDLRLNDNSKYFCHVWFKNAKTTVIQDETSLQVEVPATILSLTLVTDDTGATLVCKAEGNPPANITWIDLENSTLPMSSSEMRITGDLESVGKLVLPRPRGSYRCVAANQHGNDTREIHLAKKGTSAWVLARYIVVSTLTLVHLVVFVVWFLKKAADNNGWTMEIPDKVTGREGNSLFLFCFFTPPFNEYEGNISIIWKNAKGNVTFLHYTNYPSAHGFENHIWNNKDSRYQILGNPRKNDASIVIKQLRSDENGKGFCCQIDFTEESTGQCEEGIRTKITDVQGARLSPMTVKVGDSATLPCNFTPPDKKPSSIGIIWMKGNLPNVSIVFNQTRYHSANRPYTNTVNEGDRYELVGNPEQGNASVKVTKLRLNDNSKYFCHVWFKNAKTTVIQDETSLQVEGPATILSLTLVTDDTGATLVCKAEGNPPANITWIDLENSTLPMSSSEMRVTGDLESVGKLVLPRPRGSYRCVAANQHGNDTCEIHLAKTGTSALALSVALSSLAIILLVVFVVWFLKKGSRQHRCCVDSGVASGVKSRTAEPDLQLESDPIYSIVNSTAEATPQVAPATGQNDPQESLNQQLYSNANFQTDSQTKMDPQEDPHLPVYSIVQIRKHSEAGQRKDPHDSPSHGLYSKVQFPIPRRTKTAAIYATVAHPDEQSSDVSND
ncbi:uncharacterized protein [Mobula birostris]|uniref:uncharacterized protein n=1 Tax=Mobula birostris TaxID=1983395 RepID=UPI003B283C41